MKDAFTGKKKQYLAIMGCE